MRPPILICRWSLTALLPVPILLSAALAAADRDDRDQAAVKTAKERLVSKAADAQRVDDCKVPVELRDADHPRPDDYGPGTKVGTRDRRVGRD
jgi:hypothetical protein